MAVRITSLFAETELTDFRSRDAAAAVLPRPRARVPRQVAVGLTVLYGPVRQSGPYKTVMPMEDTGLTALYGPLDFLICA